MCRISLLTDPQASPMARISTGWRTRVTLVNWVLRIPLLPVAPQSLPNRSLLRPQWPLAHRPPRAQNALQNRPLRCPPMPSLPSSARHPTSRSSSRRHTILRAPCRQSPPCRHLHLFTYAPRRLPLPHLVIPQMMTSPYPYRSHPLRPGLPNFRKRVPRRPIRLGPPPAGATRTPSR